MYRACTSCFVNSQIGLHTSLSMQYSAFVVIRGASRCWHAKEAGSLWPLTTFCLPHQQHPWHPLKAVGAVDMPALPSCEALCTFLLFHELSSPCHYWRNCLLLQCWTPLNRLCARYIPVPGHFHDSDQCYLLFKRPLQIMFLFSGLYYPASNRWPCRW